MEHLVQRRLFFAGFLVLASSCASGAFAACTPPSHISNGQIAHAPQVMANINAIASCADTRASSGFANSVQISNGAGGFGNINPLTDGQLIAVTATGSAPQITALISGSGISITNQPDVISISRWTSASGNSAKTNQTPLAMLFYMTNMALSVSFSSKFP